MRDQGDEDAIKAKQLHNVVEVNPLLRFLGLGAEGGRLLRPRNQLKRIVLGHEGPRLLQALLRASRLRVLACLAYIDCAPADMSESEVVAFLTSAPDNLILEQVLARVEGPGTEIAPGLKAALRTQEPLRSEAVGILNRLLAQGCSRQAALAAASSARHLQVRANLGFVEKHDLHPLTLQTAHLCGCERAIIALDRIIHCLEWRAPGVLPDARELHRLEDLDDLKNLLKRRILRHRGEVALPNVSHPRLEWLRSVPRIRAAGRQFENCLGAISPYPISLVLGRSFLAIYHSEEGDDPEFPNDGQYVLDIRPVWEDGRMVMTILEAKCRDNIDMPGYALMNALEDLNAATDREWRIDLRMALDDLLLLDWQLLFD
jgi:hypothetical protein